MTGRFRKVRQAVGVLLMMGKLVLSWEGSQGVMGEHGLQGAADRLNPPSEEGGDAHGAHGENWRRAPGLHGPGPQRCLLFEGLGV